MKKKRNNTFKEESQKQLIEGAILRKILILFRKTKFVTFLKIALAQRASSSVVALSMSGKID